MILCDTTVHFTNLKCFKNTVIPEVTFSNGLKKIFYCVDFKEYHGIPHSKKCWVVSTLMVQIWTNPNVGLKM